MPKSQSQSMTVFTIFPIVKKVTIVEKAAVNETVVSKNLPGQSKSGSCRLECVAVSECPVAKITTAAREALVTVNSIPS